MNNNPYFATTVSKNAEGREFDSGRTNTQGLRRECCLCNYIRKWLDFQVFSDKDDKPEVPYVSQITSMFMFISSLWDVKEPTHYSRRVGNEVPGVVAVLCVYMGGWV